MENVIHTTGRIEHAHVVAYIADVELELGTGKTLAHVILLFLITAENTDFSDVGFEEAFEDGVAEGASAAGDEEGFVVKQHENSYFFS